MRLKQAVAGLLSRLKRAPAPEVAPPAAPVPAAPPALSAQALCDRGTERLRSGEIEAAIADFSSAIDLDAACSKAYAGRGVALERAGKTDDAKRDYAKSIEIDLRLMLQSQYGYSSPK